MQSLFYVSHDGEQMGPYSISQLVELLESGQLQPTDYMYVEAQSDWIALMEHPDLLPLVASLSPTGAGVTISNPQEQEHSQAKKSSAEPIKEEATEWFILRGENRFGPFTYVDLIRMLQSRSLYEFEYIWHQGLSSWKRVAELPEFSAEKIKEALSASSENHNSDVFFRRRHKRGVFGGSVVVHDNRHLWKGVGVEISSGGAGIIIQNATLQPGQIIYMHFKPGDGVPAFNATCEIVNKQFLPDVTASDAPVRYGVKFQSIPASARKSIGAYIDQISAESSEDKVISFSRGKAA